jgi:DnaD/phage-associated family protein
MTLNDLLSHGALADIDSLTELKVTVFCVWAFAQHDAPNGLRWVRRADFDAPNQALHGLTPDELDDGLRRAVQRGTLLHTCARTPSGETDLYLAPTPEALALLATEGGLAARLSHDGHLDILPPRPTVYKLYEDNIGPLTGLIGDALHDLLADYGEPWVRDSITTAAERNKRSLAYIKGVLRGWRKDGKHHADPKRPAGADEKSASGQFADLFKR